MEREARVVALVGNPKVGSRTLTVAQEIAAQLGVWLAARGARPRVEHLDLAELSAAIFDFESAPVEEALQRVGEADLLVVASPTYKATYTGLLKAFLDRLPPNGLGGHIAIPVMVGAAPIHALAVETYLRPLLIELGASCPTRGLFVLEVQLPDLPAVVAKWLETAGPMLGAVGDSLKPARAGV